ncbi:alpha/beta fold hydrolase [Asticcacaulis sp. YBE204]|uniref:alpha/beta fold hydrolase n=1 Tax=Asticcacaulis sp. YBE204 TaxID=1282363 RepID=UPI00138AFEB5|nr:alpha/beta hydrolase [Asticcacaulis sp. YBE204]
MAALIYLGWSWYEGDLLRSVDGDLIRVREDWQLWTAAVLLLWSVVGGMIVKPLLSKRDRRVLDTERKNSRQMAGVNGASLYVESHGSKTLPTLILTHGWGLDSTIWGYAKQDLSSAFNVVTWDLPGMGMSKPGEDGVNLPAFAANLKHLIEQVSYDKVILVSHSIGGMTTQTLARDYPEFFEARVAGVVLLNTSYTNPLKTMILSKLVLALQKPLIEPMMMITRWLTPLAWLSGWQSYFNGMSHLANRIGFGSSVTHSQLEHTALLSTRNSPGAQALGNLSMFHWDATEALAGSTVPVLAIGGKVDLVTKVEASETIASIAPRGSLLKVEDANHMGFLERFEDYNAAISAFATTSIVR